MENKLIPLTEFVNRIDELVPKEIDQYFEMWKQNQLSTIKRYSAFLSQPLTLSMFVPIMEDGNPLPKPDETKYLGGRNDSDFLFNEQYWFDEAEKCLFEGFECLEDEEGKYLIDKNDNTYYPDHFGKPTIQNLINDSLTLTPTALKQIYG